MPPLRKILIALVAADIVLGTVAYLVVFYNTPGTYEIANSPIPTTSTTLSSSTIAIGTSTASSTISASSSGSAGGSPSAGTFASNFSLPYPVSWTEGDASISVMGAALQGNQLTLELTVAAGSSMQCIPLNIRMLVDEQGDLAAPETTQFTFPETGSCEGAPGATYTDQQVVFDVDPTALPLFFTTGGASNIFFEVATTTGNGMSVSVPQKNG